MKTIYFLEEGQYYQDRGLVVAASSTKSGLLRFIKDNYPDFKRGKEADIFFESDKKQTWLRCDFDIDKCKIVS